MRQILLADGWRCALVDDADYEIVAQYRWYAVHAKPGSEVVYAVRRWSEAGRQHGRKMHTLITGWPLVDHKDRNGLNNQRENLRLATSRQNQMNRRPNLGHRFKGISRVDNGDVRASKSTRWRARIQTETKTEYLGSFRTPEDAARAYNEAALRYFGEFARLNEIGEAT